MPVNVRLLGSVEVDHAGGPLPLRGRQERAIVARLALDAGYAVPVSRLVAAVWDDPPDSAEASVRVLVSRIRGSWLAAGVDALRSATGGYVLDADTDVTRFATSVKDGLRELAAKDYLTAATTLRAALNTWRGDALNDVVSGRLRVTAAHLQEQRLAATEALFEAELACGNLPDVLVETERLCAENPLREPLWALRMRVLYAGGRQAGALATFATLRTTLRDELGIEPGSAICDLQRAILKQDPALNPPLPGTAAAIPLPGPLTVAERTPLTGREKPLRLAAGLWEQVRSGGSGVMLVSGDAGIGKSRLLREIARLVHADDGAVLYGRCDEDLAVPYRPFVESMSHLVAHTPGAVFAQVSPDLMTRLLPLLGGGDPYAASTAGSNGDLGRFRLFGAVDTALRAAGARRPTLLVLDDIHWADRSTLLLLAHLSSSVIPGLMLLASCRQSRGEPHELTNLTGSLARTATVTRCTLTALSVGQVEDMLAARGPQQDESIRALATQLHQITGGNPFFVTETVQHLRDRQVLERVGNRWNFRAGPDALQPPDNVVDVIRARIHQLGRETAELLSHAAVLGVEFDLDVLARAAGMPASGVLGLCEPAEHIGLVLAVAGHPQRRRFAHALVAQTLYADLAPSRRTLLHEAAAAAFTALGTGEPGQIAFHSLAGMTADTTGQAVIAATAAGDYALASFAPDEAVRWYTAAFNAMPPPRHDLPHARAMLKLGVAQRQAGLPEHRATLLGAAHIAGDVDDGPLLIATALAIHRGGFASLGNVDIDRLKVFDAALEYASANSQDRARLLAVRASELTWHPDLQERLGAAHDAIAAARAVDDPSTTLFAITQTLTTQWVPETTDQRLALLTEALDITDRSGDPTARAHVRHMLATTFLERARGAEAADMAREAHELSARSAEPFTRYIGAFVSGCNAVGRSDLERAETQAEAVLQIGTGFGQPDARHWYEELLFFIRWQQGRLAEMLDDYRATAHDLPVVTSRAAELAYLEVTVGDADRARTLIDSRAQTGFRTFYGPSWMGTTCLWADVAAHLQHVEAAAAIHGLLEPWGDRIATAGPLPVHAVAYSLGQTARILDRPDAKDHFERAIDLHQQATAPFGAALAHLALADLIESTDRLGADNHRTAAKTLASTFGFSTPSTPTPGPA